MSVIRLSCVEVKQSATVCAHIASEVAPASGVPTLRSASGRARPTLGRSSAVARRGVGGDVGAAPPRLLPLLARRRPRFAARRRTAAARRASSCRPVTRRRAGSARRSRRACPAATVAASGRPVSPEPGAERRRASHPTARRRCRRPWRPTPCPRRSSTEPVPRTVVDRVWRRGVAGRRGPLDHAAAVVAVAGDGVDAAQFVLGVGQHLGHRLERPRDQRCRRDGRRRRTSSATRVVAAAASAAASVRRSPAAAGTAAPLRYAGVSAGAVQYRSSSSSSHITVSEQPAMSRLVTSSPTSGSTMSNPRSRSSRATVTPHHEQLLVLGAAKSVEDHRDSL